MTAAVPSAHASTGLLAQRESEGVIAFEFRQRRLTAVRDDRSIYVGMVVALRTRVMNKPAFAFVRALAAGSVAEAATIHVPADAATIQRAISAAAPGDTVLVAPARMSKPHVSRQGIMSSARAVRL